MLEYTVSAVRGYPSSMALGRGLFIFYNHALYLAAHSLFNLSAQRAYLLFKYVVVAQGLLSVVACWTLARDLSGSLVAATIAALLVATSPMFVVYSGQVMTDVPALLLINIALIIHLRGLQQRRMLLVLIGAALLGAGVNLRETVLFYAPWLVLAPFCCEWKLRRRDLSMMILSCVIFFLFAFGGFVYWFLSDPAYRAAWFGWRESMRVESARHPPDIRNVWPWLMFLFATSPLILITIPIALVNQWRERKWSPIFLLALVGLFADILLLLNYSTAINWRYLLSGLPALAPLGASFLTRSLTKRFGSSRSALIACSAVIGVIAIAFVVFLWPLRLAQVEVRAAAKDYDRQLAQLPRDAVMISGAQTVAVMFWGEMGEGQWEVIGTGSGWPESRLANVIEDYLKQNRRVFIDTDPRWWQPCGWHISEIGELTKIEPRFHFRRVTQTIYEIRPITDPNATDAPELKTLLPEYRVNEVKKCFNPG